MLYIFTVFLILPDIGKAQGEQGSVQTPFLTSSQNYLCEIGVDFTRLLDANGTEVPFETAHRKSLKKEKKAKKRSKKLLKKSKAATGKTRKRLKKKAKKARQMIQPERDFREELAECQNQTLPPAIYFDVANGFGSDSTIPISYDAIGGHFLFVQGHLIKMDIPITSSNINDFAGYIRAKGLRNSEQTLNTPLYTISGFFRGSNANAIEKLQATLSFELGPFTFTLKIDGRHSSQAFRFGFTTVIPAFRVEDKGDIDADGDIDFNDYIQFTSCYSGPNISAPTDCAAADSDGDGDVDFQDYQLYFGSGLKLGDSNNWSWG